MKSRDHGSRSGKLYTASDIKEFADDLPALQETLEWVKNYLAKPHPHLGRPGTVCPFVPFALKLNTIQLTVAHARSPDAAALNEVVSAYREIFLDLEPREGEAALYKAILIIFPCIPGESAPTLIEGIQKSLKPSFVEAGLMIGEFHELNDTPGLHNPELRPLRSPIPMLAIRFMVENDLLFLMREIDPPHLRIRHLRAFLKHMDDMASAATLKLASAALTQAEHEANNAELFGQEVASA